MAVLFFSYAQTFLGWAQWYIYLASDLLSCFLEYTLTIVAHHSTLEMVPIFDKRKLDDLAGSDIHYPNAKRILPIREKQSMSGPTKEKLIVGVDYGTSFTGNNPHYT